MAKKVIIIILISILTILIFYLLVQYFYLRPLKAQAKIEFDKKSKEIIFSFKYPVSKNYFLKSFEMIPEARGEFVFEEEVSSAFPLLGYREIRYCLFEIERDRTYKVKIFDREFSFALPSPKPREICFDEEKKEIEITFFDPIEEDYFFKKFKIEPQISGEYIFLDLNKKVILKLDGIEKDKDYKVEILGKSLTFKIESLKTEKIFFDRRNKVIIMTFTRPIKEEYFLENFKISPYLKGKFIFLNSGDKVIFKPSNIKEGKNYKVDILGKSLGFKIELPSLLKPQLVSREKFIQVDLSEQKLRLHQGGKIIANYLISSGKPGMPTPVGNFKVTSKERNHWSATYGLYMPYSLKLYNGYYIHELPYWPGGYREGEEHLGRPVSHGCVRLGIGAAEEVFNFATIGTRVIIHR